MCKNLSADFYRKTQKDLKKEKKTCKRFQGLCEKK